MQRGPRPNNQKINCFRTVRTWPTFRAAQRKGGQDRTIRKAIVFGLFGVAPLSGLHHGRAKSEQSENQSFSDLSNLAPFPGCTTKGRPSPNNPKTNRVRTGLTWPLFRCAALKGGPIRTIRKPLVFGLFGPGPLSGMHNAKEAKSEQSENQSFS